MKTLRSWMAPLMIFASACSPAISSPRREGEQPRVVNVQPNEGATIQKLDAVHVSLSIPIDPSTVNERTFLVAAVSVAMAPLFNGSQLTPAIDKGTIASLPGTYIISEDGKTIAWHPQDPVHEDGAYAIILTPQIKTPDHWPLSQTPANGLTPFIAQVKLDSVELQGDPSQVELDDKPALEELVINEACYDAVGSDTDGHAFVELYGTPGADISRHIIRFINGADGEQTDEITLRDGTTIPEDGLFVIADSRTSKPLETHVVNADHIDNFDPQNGPDSIQLIKPSGGDLMDVVGYGDGMMARTAEGLPLYEGDPTPGARAGECIARINGKDTNQNHADLVVNTQPSPGTLDVTRPAPMAEEKQTGAGAAENSSDQSGSGERSMGEEMVIDEPIAVIHQESPGTMKITEVVTDPQVDWNDSVGGNGVHFDAVPGNGSIGSTDEWIEMRNFSTQAVNLTGWKVKMMDGTDAMDDFSSPQGDFFFSEGAAMDKFPPEAILVMGNPPGDMKNSITLQLLDETDDVVDEVVIDDGNSYGPENEAYQWVEDDTWTRTEATPGW